MITENIVSWETSKQIIINHSKQSNVRFGALKLQPHIENYIKNNTESDALLNLINELQEKLNNKTHKKCIVDKFNEKKQVVNVALNIEDKIKSLQVDVDKFEDAMNTLKKQYIQFNKNIKSALKVAKNNLEMRKRHDNGVKNRIKLYSNEQIRLANDVVDVDILAMEEEILSFREGDDVNKLMGVYINYIASRPKTHRLNIGRWYTETGKIHGNDSYENYIVSTIHGNKCAMCGCEEKLEIHHIEELSVTYNRDIENMIPVCHDCHCKIHGFK